MKRAILVILAALGLAVLSAVTTYCIQKRLASKPSELEWLRTEFHLSDAQFQKIVSLHSEYRPQCETMCRQFSEANSKLGKLISESRGMTPEISKQLRHVEQVEAECREGMLSHIYAVAREMNPDQGQRYISIMTQSMFVHTGSPDAAVRKQKEP